MGCKLGTVMRDFIREKTTDIFLLYTYVTEKEQMKERFAKLLLGEDMSGGGEGVSSALALSNAITNLSASAFGEQRRLEPMSQDRKERWRREIGWFLSVTDHIVEFSPTHQTNEDGSSMEVSEKHVPFLIILDLRESFVSVCI